MSRETQECSYFNSSLELITFRACEPWIYWMTPHNPPRCIDGGCVLLAYVVNASWNVSINVKSVKHAPVDSETWARFYHVLIFSCSSPYHPTIYMSSKKIDASLSMDKTRHTHKSRIQREIVLCDTKRMYWYISNCQWVDRALELFRQLARRLYSVIVFVNLRKCVTNKRQNTYWFNYAQYKAWTIWGHQ